MDNRENILPLLNFSDPDKFYFIQIYKRRKDNPGMDKDMKVLGNYAIFSRDQFDKTFEEIKNICDSNNARAYIRLNRRSQKKCALQMLARIAKMISMDQYNVKNLYWSIAGEFPDEEDKTWLFDIDYIDFEAESGKRHLDSIEEKITRLQRECGRVPMLIKIPSKNGYHLITRPFDISQLKKTLDILERRVDHHKDNPTILYTA